ncbi:MAG: CPBP family intramembrane metalloprotease [Clostridiales bacterium]|nr:CPBP family intramembrane metalloprotease [Clostridiales bacterium]
MAENKTTTTPTAKPKKQRFIDKHTIATSIILIFGLLFLSEVMIGGVLGVIGRFTGQDAAMFGAIGGIVGGVISYVIWRLIFKKDYRPCKFGQDFLKTLKLSLPILIVWVVLIGIYAYNVKGNPFRMLAAAQIPTALMAGVVEEIIFREIGVAYLARQYRGANKFKFIVVFTSILFALSHLINAALGRTFLDVFGQVVLCVGAGLFYAGIYLHTGNVWPLILVHALHDVIAFSVALSMDGGKLPVALDLAQLLPFFVIGAYGLYLVRKANWDKMNDCWKDKWADIA